MRWKFWEKSAKRLSSGGASSDFKWRYLLQAGTLSRTPHGAMRLFRECSAVSIPIKLIANTVGMIDPVLRDGDKVIQQDDKLVLLLKNPKFGLSSALFFKMLAIHQTVVGRGYVWAGGNINHPPIELDIVSPLSVTLDISISGAINSIQVINGIHKGFYKAVRDGIRTRYISNNFSEIGTIRGFTSRGDDCTMTEESPLEAVGAEIEQIIQGAVHNNSLLKNGGTLSTIFSLKGDLSDDQFDNATKEINAKYGGTNKAGSIGVVSAEDVEIKQLGNTPKDLDFEKLQKMARKQVALQYGVPIGLVDNEKSTFNNMETSNGMLFDNACAPVIAEILDGLEFFLFPRYKKELGVFNLDFEKTELPILRQRFIAELETRKKVGVETVNELRQLINREPISEGGDDLYWPIAQAPIGSDVFTEDGQARLLDDDLKPEEE